MTAHRKPSFRKRTNTSSHELLQKEQFSLVLRGNKLARMLYGLGRYLTTRFFLKRSKRIGKEQKYGESREKKHRRRTSLTATTSHMTERLR